MNDFGKTIRILRSAKDFSSSDLARKAQISKPFLSLVESGRRQPSLEVLRRLAGALEIPSETLVLLAMSDSKTLTSSDIRAQQLADSINKMTVLEDHIRLQLKGHAYAPKRANT